MMKNHKSTEALSTGVPIFPVISIDTRVSSLIGRNSWFLFEALKLDTSWMSQPIANWEKYEDYVKALKFATHVKVVNDLAERGVKLASDFHIISQRTKKIIKTFFKVSNITAEMYPILKRSHCRNFKIAEKL